MCIYYKYGAVTDLKCSNILNFVISIKLFICKLFQMLVNRKISNYNKNTLFNKTLPFFNVSVFYDDGGTNKLISIIKINKMNSKINN